MKWVELIVIFLWCHMRQENPRVQQEGWFVIVTRSRNVRMVYTRIVLYVTEKVVDMVLRKYC